MITQITRNGKFLKQDVVEVKYARNGIVVQGPLYRVLS